MKYEVVLNNKIYEIEVEKGKARIENISEVAVAAAAPQPQSTQEAPKVAVNTVAGEVVASPLPGAILNINVSAGQSVKKGQVLLILEAMKMENEVVAPRDAVIKQVAVNKGASVETGDTLIVLE